MIFWVKFQWYKFKCWTGFSQLSPAGQMFRDIAKKHGFKEMK